MSALDDVLADLVESDRECAYLTLKRGPLETLIEQWFRRGDQIAIFHELLAQAQIELTLAWAGQAEQGHSRTPNLSQQTTLQTLNAATTESASLIAHHRHALRKEFAARLKQTLRSAAAELGVHITEALLLGNTELADRFESERQTVQIVVGTIDAIVSRLMKEELVAAGQSGGQDV